jgi:hypothetical protein
MGSSRVVCKPLSVMMTDVVLLPAPGVCGAVVLRSL